MSISLHGDAAQTNFPVEQYSGEMQQQFAGMGREELQRALGVKPMDKSSRYIPPLVRPCQLLGCIMLWLACLLADE